MKTKIKAYLNLFPELYVQKNDPAYVRISEELIKENKNILRPVVARVFAVDENDVEFVIPTIVGMAASEYKSNEMFKFGKRITDYMGDCDCVCMSMGWEVSHEGIAEATTALMFNRPIIAITYYDLDNSNDEDILIACGNIPDNVFPEASGSNEFVKFSDYAWMMSKNTVGIYVSTGFDMTDICQHYWSNQLDIEEEYDED